MPNWSYNTIALQGKKEAVHGFIKLGLRNSNLETSDDIQKDFAMLIEQGQTKDRKDGENFSDTEKPAELTMKKWLSARTFLPMPDTFLMYDTTNYPNAFPVELVKEQKEKYGAVGWYDYNCLTLGTKWDFGLCDHDSEAELEEAAPGVWRFKFYCETAWSMPLAWCGAMKKQFPDLMVAVVAQEESSAYLCVGEVDADGELDEYADITQEMEDGYKAWTKEREEAAKRIKADAEKMKLVKEKVAERMKNDSNGQSEETITDREIDDLVDEECGDCFDDTEIVDKLYYKFKELLESKI